MSPKILLQPVEHLLQRLGSSSRGQRVIVGLVGLPGSGKSTLAKSLQARVNASLDAQRMLSIGMDGFHLTKKQLAELPNPQKAFARRGAPWTFDPAGLAQRLQMLRASPLAAVDWPGFEHDVGDPVQAALHIGPNIQLVLIEGLYLLHEADGWNVSSLLDECWFLDVPLPLAMQRLQARHMAAWGMSAEQAQARIKVNDEINAVLVQTHRQRAHWLVSDIP